MINFWNSDSGVGLMNAYREGHDASEFIKRMHCVLEPITSALVPLNLSRFIQFLVWILMCLMMGPAKWSLPEHNRMRLPFYTWSGYWMRSQFRREAIMMIKRWIQESWFIFHNPFTRVHNSWRRKHSSISFTHSPWSSSWWRLREWIPYASS